MVCFHIVQVTRLIRVNIGKLSKIECAAPHYGYYPIYKNLISAKSFLFLTYATGFQLAGLLQM